MQDESLLKPSDFGIHSRHVSQNTINLSHEADEADSDGDLYDHYGDIPPPYAQHDDCVVPQSEPVVLTNPDRKSVGRIVVATIIIYVMWVTIQVIQRMHTLERYLA